MSDTQATHEAATGVTSHETRMAVEKIVSFVARTPGLAATLPEQKEQRERAIARASGLLMNGNWQRAIVAVAGPLPPASSGMEARARFVEAWPEDALPPPRRVGVRRKKRGRQRPEVVSRSEPSSDGTTAAAA